MENQHFTPKKSESKDVLTSKEYKEIALEQISTTLATIHELGRNYFKARNKRVFNF